MSLDITDLGVVNTLFPFHFFLDRDLNIVSRGKSLNKVLPEGKGFNDCFQVVRPGLGMELHFDSMSSYASQIFILRLTAGKVGLLLKGQFLVCPNKTFLLFCGSPWIVSETTFRDSGLMVSDFAIHDSLIDLLHHFKAQQMAMDDVKKLNAQLQEKNTLLEQFNREFNIGTSDGDSIYNKSSYEAFLQQYHDLQLKVTQFASVELELNNIRIRLDDELEMYKRMQRFSSTALKVDTKRAFVEALAESVVDVFETEGALVLLEQFGDYPFTILKCEGLTFAGVPEENLQQCVRNVSNQLQSGSSHLISSNSLQNHPAFAKVQEALWFSFHDEGVGMRLHIAGLISVDKGQSYHPLLERHCTIFSVFAQKSVSLLANLHREVMIRRQLESEQVAVEEMKKLNHQLMEYNQELEKLNRDLDQFVYSASHDLRAPALAIAGIVDEMLDPATEEETIRQDIVRIQKVIGRLDDTITDIVSYSKNSRLPMVPEKIDLEGLIHELFDSLRYLKKFDIELVVDLNISCDLWTDKSRIQSLLKNLVSNAIKFSVERSEGSWIHITGKVEADVCKLEIEDNGEGIPQEYQARVFDMFYRASSTSHGTGLGLYICKEIVKKLGGTIHLQSTFGKGTSLTLSFPNQPSNG